jgi:hypothetical protein
MWEALFAFHISIAQGFAEPSRCSVCKRAMGPLAVIFLMPVVEGSPSVIQGAEPVRIQTFVVKTSMEAFDVSVLHRSPRLDVDQVDLAFFSPAPHAPRCELRFVVGTTLSGSPRCSISRSSSRVTRPLPRLVSASSTRHSRVNASTTLRMRIMRPFANPSTMKSIAHSWFARIRRGSINCSRTSRLRQRRRTAKPCSTYSR